MTLNPNDYQIVSKISGKQRTIRFLNFIHPLIFIAIPALIFWGFTCWERQTAKGICLVVLGFLCIPLFILTGKQVNKLLKKLKENLGEYIIRDILAEHVQINQYSPNEHINNDFVKNCPLLPGYDRITGSDYISGIYRGVEFTFCDLHLEYESKSRDRKGRKETRYRTNFQGHVITLQTKENIDGFVRIRERENPRKEKNFLSDFVSGAAEFLGINQNIVEMESDPFNRQFKVDSSNEHLAFYILTPQFMERIVAADAKADGYTNIEFASNRITLALNNGRDSFEAPKTIGSLSRLEKTRQAFRDEFETILSIIDEILTKENFF